MRPLKLQLTDWCQHESRSIVFVQGMNGIQGPNGSGKTNLLEALNLCFGLDTNLGGKKTDCIRSGCQKATVDLTFEHNHTEGNLRIVLSRNYDCAWQEQQARILSAQRALSDNLASPESPLTAEQRDLAGFKPRETVKYSLKWGDVECRNVTEVSDFLRVHTGLDPKVIQTNYFPRQGDVDGVLSASSDDRRRIFAEKAGVALCPKIWDELGVAVRQQPDLGAAEQRLLDAQARLSAAVGEEKRALVLVDEQKTAPLDASAETEIVRRYMAALKNSKAVEELQVRHAAAVSAVEEANGRVAALYAEGTALRAQHDERAPHISGIQKRVWEIQQQEKALQRRQQLVQQLEEAEKGLQLPEPQKPDFTKESVIELASKVDQVRTRVQMLEQWMLSLGRGVCPTCGQPVTGLTEKAASERDELVRSISGVREDLERRRALMEAYSKAQLAYESARSRLVTQREMAARELQALGDPRSADSTELASLQKSLDDFKALSEKLGSVRTQHTNAVAALQTATANANTVSTSLQVALAGVAGGECPTEAQFKEASDFCTRVQLNQQSLREAEIKLAAATAVRQQLQKDVESLKADVDKMIAVKRWISLLSEVRAVFHRDAFPAEIVAWYAQQLAEHTQKYLDMFGAGFRLEVNNDLDLLGIFPDKVMPAYRFSGGEKNITNISMRLALIDLFPSEFNLLVLDEVEVHLDQDKIAKLPMILEQVKGLARNRGLVVLFISHHPLLSGIADHVIRSDG